MITILFLAADPSNKLRLDDEARAIDLSLHKANLREHFNFEQHWAVRISDLQELLLRYKPHIVHFSGHGNVNSEIVLYDDYGKSTVVSVNALKSLFSTLSGNIQCVILNSCYSKAQAKAIAEKIHYVIGMSDKVTDEAAKIFSTAFYRAIGYGEDIKTAFDLGVNQINLENLGEQETPKLISLKADRSKVVLAVKNTKMAESLPKSESETKMDVDDLNDAIGKYVEQNPLLTDIQVVDKLSNIVKAKIN